MKFELCILVMKLKAEFWNAGDCPSIEELEKNLSNPKWEEKSKVHDWRNYVPEIVQVSWNSLEKETQVVVWFMANEAADNEEWE